jgi:hypothetical protein
MNLKRNAVTYCPDACLEDWEKPRKPSRCNRYSKPSPADYKIKRLFHRPETYNFPLAPAPFQENASGLEVELVSFLSSALRGKFWWASRSVTFPPGKDSLRRDSWTQNRYHMTSNLDCPASDFFIDWDASCLYNYIHSLLECFRALYWALAARSVS